MIALLILLALHSLHSLQAKSDLEKTKENAQVVHHITSKKNTKKEPKNDQELIWFRFSEEPLKEIVYYLANKKKLNIILPEGKDILTQKLTFQLQEKIPVSQAWDLLLLFLRATGYTITEQKDFSLLIQTKPSASKDANKQNFPLYIQTEAENLPQNNAKIIYIYSFANLQLSPASSTSSFLGSTNSNGILSIIQALLSSDATLVTDTASNSIIIVDYARSIASTIGILAELDVHEFTDTVSILPLKHTTAKTVVSLLQSLIYGTSTNTPGNVGNLSLGAASHYFSQKTRMIPEQRTNSLILMGKKDSLEKVKDFVKKYIDIPLETGESILHIYDLQYLQATTFQKTLQSIVNNQGGSGGSLGTQSTGSSSGAVVNGEQYFKGVIIQAESNITNNSQGYNNFFNNNSNQVSLAQPSQAANRLLIAARHEDWIRIKELIKELDKPQLQVAIEVLIVDLNLSRNKSLGSQIRNKSGLSIKDTNFQTNHLGGLQLKDSNINPTAADALMGNLLQLTNGSNLANSATGGSLILSFKDGTNGMWMISQILNNYSDVKILSQPFIVALNNQQSSFSLTENRLLTTASVPSGGGAAVAQQTSNAATLSVNVQPLISNRGKINLALNINVGEYGPSNSTLNRSITTNANLNDGEVLVLGGLIKTKISDQVIKTPLLSSIPLLGWAFKNKQKTIVKDNLLIFMSPRIINTHPNEFNDPFTKDKMYSMGRILAKGENFESLKDPITQWFFGVDDSEIATQRIRAFEKKEMFAPPHIYNKNTHQNHKVFSQKTKIPAPKKKNKTHEKTIVQTKKPVEKTMETTDSLKTKTTNQDKKEITIDENEKLKKLFKELKKPQE